MFTIVAVMRVQQKIHMFISPPAHNVAPNHITGIGIGVIKVLDQLLQPIKSTFILFYNHKAIKHRQMYETVAE